MQVIEGVQNQDHGIVYCRLCKRHNRTNTFAYEGYRCLSFPIAIILQNIFVFNAPGHVNQQVCA